MDNENRPVGRKKKITEGGSGVHKRGEGLGTGPVGQSGGYSQGQHSSADDGGMRRSSGRSPLFMIIIILVLLLGGGGGISSLFGGGSVPSGGSIPSQGTVTSQQGTNSQTGTNTANVPGDTTQTGSGLSTLAQLFGGGMGSYSGANVSSASWSAESNTGNLNRDVDPKARAKRTTIKGNGQDTITIMMYMCGADLESRGAMATKDIQEMLKANLGNNINLLVYTGGCRQWQNNVVSSSTNQIYQIKDGKMALLVDNVGNLPMTKPDTLSAYIKWAAKNFPADRYELIFWNHGGGSTGGYGYDERFASAGAMSLAGINTALKDGGVNFDFVGFDTCLMATVENALVVSNYADYLIASEETEPGVGWYYTDWLTALGSNTSMDTLDIGKNIIDSYTAACAQTCPGQKTTLSLMDLSELSQTVPSELADFAKDTTSLIQKDEFATVSKARSSTREFAQSRIDQIDIIDFANRMGTDEAKELAEVLRSAIKYNRTSSNMTNSYGLSIYFPYKTASKVDNMLSTYQAIGMGEDYAKCIKNFAQLGTAGQVAAGGTQSPMPSLFGEMPSSGGGSSAELISQLLSTFLSSDFSSISGLSSSNTDFFGRDLDIEKTAEYIANNRFDPAALIWTNNDNGEDVISLSESDWSKIENLKLNMFYDDGEGYIDLGMDNVFEFDDKGNLKSQDDKTWLAIDGQVVPYYVVDVQGDSSSYQITGRVPCLLNEDAANLILVFDSQNEDGYVAGAVREYKEGETETIAKNMTELEEGDTIDFVCDYYNYDKEYSDSYLLGERMVVKGKMSDMQISNVYVGDGTVLETYCFTDIFGQDYWTPALKH